MTVDETPALNTFRTFMLRWVTVLLILPEEIIFVQVVNRSSRWCSVKKLLLKSLENLQEHTRGKELF